MDDKEYISDLKEANNDYQVEEIEQPDRKELRRERQYNKKVNKYREHTK